MDVAADPDFELALQSIQRDITWCARPPRQPPAASRQPPRLAAPPTVGLRNIAPGKHARRFVSAAARLPPGANDS